MWILLAEKIRQLMFKNLSGPFKTNFMGADYISHIKHSKSNGWFMKKVKLSDLIVCGTCTKYKFPLLKPQ